MRDEMRESRSFRKGDFFGEIERLKPGDRDDQDTYIFDGDFRMVELFPNVDRWNREDGDYINCLNDPEAYQVFVPLPFYSDVLQGAVCAEEELPENQQMLKRISAVYKGEMDFMELIRRFSKREI